MRYMCLMKSSETNGETPPAVYEAMAEYDRWGRATGILVDSQGLLPSDAGHDRLARRREHQGGRRPVHRGEGARGGYALIEVRTRDEAVELGRRLMQIHKDHWPGFEGSVEIRQIAEF